MATLKTQKLLSTLKNNSGKIFSDDVQTNSKLVREYFLESSDIIEQAHKAKLGGLAVCTAISFLVDEILMGLYANFIKRRADKKVNVFKDKFCIVALGGYGRSEMSPKSDVDLMFLYDESSKKISDEIKTLAIDEMMYPLWDTRLKLGHCSRNIEETIKEAKADILSKTALLDMRLVCGSQRLFSKLQKEFKKYCAVNSANHIDELFRLKRDRHTKFGWTPYLQEPNIKNGIGGLRDYHTICWMAQLKYGGKMRRLAELKIISTSEFKAIQKSYDYLLQVRNDMHYTLNRSSDLLDLDTQTKIARHLGFTQRDIVLRSEKFMRQVYFCFRDIDNISKSARKRMKIILPEDVLASITPKNIDLSDSDRISLDGFWISKGSITPQNSSVFKKDPIRLIKVFRYCQKYGVIPSDKLEMLIKDSVYLIDDKVRANPEANASFKKILIRQGEVKPILERMHFWGVLGAFIKEFDELQCLVQHEFYHRYTADIHTLNTIAQLDKVFSSNIDSAPYGVYHAAITNTQSPQLLYLILLLHDIGKSDGVKGHAQISAEISERVLKRFEIPSSMLDTALFVIENHLMMARFWQTNDVEDESSVERFVQMVGDEEKLKYLYVLTFCDAKGTSEDLWNSYKQSLHTMLFRGALRKMRSDETQIRDLYQSKKAKVLAEVLSVKEFADNPEEVLSHFENLPRNYFLFHGRDDLVMHLRMIHTLQEAQKASGGNSIGGAIFDWHEDPNKSMTRLSVVTRDSEGLFYKLAGAITLSGLNILSSKVLSRSDGISIDTFSLTGPAGGPIRNERARAKFEQEFLEALKNHDSMNERIEQIWKDTTIPFKTEAQVRISVIADPAPRTVIEVEAYDSEGLLYKLAKMISDEGYNITFARINTERNWAIDTFFAFATSPKSEKDTLRFTKHLKKILSTESPKNNTEPLSKQQTL